MFWKKKFQYAALEFFAMVSYEEAKAFDIGNAALFMSNHLSNFSGNPKIKYSLNYDRQQIADPKKLESLMDFAKDPEVVEITGTSGDCFLGISNLLLNTEVPEERGPIFFHFNIPPDRFDESKYVKLLEEICPKFDIMHGFVRKHKGKQIDFNNGRFVWNKIKELEDGYLTGIYNYNLLNERQIDSALLKELVPKYGILKSIGSRLSLWILNDSDLKKLKKEEVVKNEC